MNLDLVTCQNALAARDARFDGRFFVGVSTTRIYCRPVCPARTPKAANCDFFVHAAAAERAGYRPCLRCRPELAPGLAPMDAPDRLARQACARIEAGALDALGLDSLASEFGVSERHLRRVVEKATGATPVELAQTRRLLLAKQLLTDTALPMALVAESAGFGSVRRFNHLFAQRYRLAPGALRKSASTDETQALPDRITLKLGYRPPLAWDALLGFLAGRGAAGVEAADEGRYLRTVQLGAHRGWIAAAPDAASTRPQLAVTLSASLLPVLGTVLPRLRRLFDLDANPLVIEAQLSNDARLKPLIAATPGLRVPGAFDGFELALRAVLGQQVTVKAASTIFARFARAFGDEAHTPFPQLTHHAPQAARIAAAPLQAIIGLGLTTRRAETVCGLARAMHEGQLRLDPGSDPDATLAALQALPGIGPWTAHYVAMRALGWPDAFPDDDLGLLKALNVTNARALREAAEAWRPWRAYAAIHCWRSLATGG
jgi:AraC family transcriptional regulator of adaptative response / DNA-3-methyladenine glycosylase II